MSEMHTRERVTCLAAAPHNERRIRGGREVRRVKEAGQNVRVLEAVVVVWT